MAMMQRRCEWENGQEDKKYRGLGNSITPAPAEFPKNLGKWMKTELHSFIYLSIYIYIHVFIHTFGLVIKLIQAELRRNKKIKKTGKLKTKYRPTWCSVSFYRGIFLKVSNPAKC